MRYIGIDVAKDKLDVFLDGMFFVFANNKQGHKKLVQLLQSDDVVDLEPTNTYHQVLVEFLVNKRVTVQLVDPLISSRYQRLGMRKQYDDKKAAQALTELAALGKGRVVQVDDVDATLTELRKLSRARQGLVKQRSMIKNKLHKEQHTVLKKAYQKLIISFDKQIQILEQEMCNVSNESTQILENIPGISAVSARIILAELGNIHRFSNHRQVVSFAGYDPTKHTSGSSVRKEGKLSKRGTPYLRHVLYLTTFANMRSNNVFSHYYQKKKSEGKHHYAAMTATSRKILQIIYALLKKQESFCLTKS